MAITFGTPSDESSTTGTSVTFNSSLFSSKGTDDGVIVALARSDQGSDVARNYAGPTGWTKLGEAESVNGSFSTTAALFWYPPGSNPSGDQVFTNDGPADFGGGSMVIVSGTSLECALEGDADRDADGDDVLIAGYAAGDADREAYAVLGVLNSGGLTVDEGSWTNHNSFDSDYGAAYRRTTTTSSAADFDTGINESFGWAAVTAMISEGSSGQAISPTGASVTVSAGSLTVTPDQPISPTGATVTVTAGTLTVAEDQQITPAGPTVTVTAGTATVDTGQPISPTGATISVTAGTLEVDQAIALTGPTVTVTTGTATVTQGITVAPDGASVSITPGTLTVTTGAVEITPTGASVSVTAGTVSVVETQPVTVTGATVTVTAGVVTLDQSVELIGATISVTPGAVTMTADQAISLTGATIAITPGTITSIIDPSNAFTGRVLAAFSLQATMAAVSLRRIRQRAAVEPVNESKGLQP